MRTLLVMVLLALAGCAPPPLLITRPVPVDRPVLVIQPVPPELLKAHPIAEGKPSELPMVAAARKEELLACNADKASMRALHGAPRDE
jgi:hypothetical protein